MGVAYSGSGTGGLDGWSPGGMVGSESQASLKSLGLHPQQTTHCLQLCGSERECVSENKDEDDY